MLNVSILRGPTAVSASQGLLEMDTTVQISHIVCYFMLVVDEHTLVFSEAYHYDIRCILMNGVQRLAWFL